MKQLSSTGPDILAALVIAAEGASPSLARSTKSGMQAKVEIDGKSYQINGTCELTRRGHCA